MTERTLTDLDFDSLGLHPTLSQGLHDAGFTRLTPIQALTLPETLKHLDVAGQAQTGTGKTAAFLVTLMQRLLTSEARPERRIQDPRAVILAPTRELAIQIHKDAVLLGGQTGLRLGLVYGGVDYEKQRAQFAEGCDVLIGTPGRLMDYLKQHVFSLRAIEVVVLDEADRMFDLGFIKDIRYLMRRLPARTERQCLLFSATLSHRVLELAYEHMNEPEKLVVEADSITANKVRQVVYYPAAEEKMPLLLNLLARMDPHRTMIFINTKVVAERVTQRLQRYGHSVATLSGDVPQRKRQTLLGRFQRGELGILVATDVAARGLHIPEVSHVFNYDLPQDAEDYVHRVGRTARLGAEGDAISFACDKYAMTLPDIEAYIEQKIPVEPLTEDLLVMPKAPPRVEPAKSEDTADGEDDGTADASADEGDKPADDKPRRRRRRRRSGSGGSGGGKPPSAGS